MRLFLLFLFLCPSLSHAADRPNIVYILADDLGYGDLACYGSALNETPHLDALAAGGVRLTDFHAASWCLPSRKALMTGSHANRDWKNGRLADAVMLPEMLKTIGYQTALIGKWHLGLEEGLHPLDQGFDVFYGTKGSNDWDGPPPNYDSFRNAPEEDWKTPLYVGRDNQGPIVPQSLFTKRYTEETIRLIEQHAGKTPFFIYFAHNMPHVPIFASEAFRGTSANGVYGDVIAEIDWSVGQIVEALTKAGELENTIVVFTSDNGPWSMFGKFGGVADPLRGEKSTTWEGGDRVPGIVSWPGTLPAAVCDEFIVNLDVYATLAAWTGAEITDGQAIDSINMAGVLERGEKSQRTKHVHYFREAMAFRSGDYKLHFKTRERTREPETGKREPSVPHDPPLLFNVKVDRAESTDLAGNLPEIVARLTKEFAAARSAINRWEPF